MDIRVLKYLLGRGVCISIYERELNSSVYELSFILIMPF